MLIRFKVTRKDTGAPVPGALVTVEKAEASSTTDAQGKAEIVTYWSGNWNYSVTAADFGGVTGTVNNRDIPVLDFSVQMLYQATPTQPPQPSGNTVVARIGTSCSIVQYGPMGGISFKVIHDSGQEFGSGFKRYSDAVARANRQAVCFETPAPVPTPAPDQSGAISGLGKEIANVRTDLAATIANVASAIGKEIANVRTDLTTAVSNLAAAINSALFDILKEITKLWGTLADIVQHAEEEAAAWRTGILNLEITIRAWIELEIVAILIRALDREDAARRR